MKNYLHLLIINMFLIQKLVNNLFKNYHIIILWNVLQVMGENDECLRRMM